MEGDGEGEGMVAIVHGLHDARLAVTVLDARSQGRRTGKVMATKSSNQVPQKVSSVETSTDGLKKSHTSSHICDGQYASSYQLAHCCLQPTSPPIHLPEFPPQRAAPNPTQGNFQVGGCGSREIGFTPVRSSFSYRGSLTWHSNRGSSLSPCRASVAFVHSLRRYPSVSPTRTLSTELVQRLLTYTQGKHFPRMSKHTKSMRSLSSKRPPFSDKQTNTKSTKNIQTYTRARQESAEKSANTNNEINFVGGRGKSRSFKFSWPSSEKRNIKYKDNQLNATYDYLKSTNLNRRLSGRGAEVRYLSDVTKCIRDTIRQIYDDKPVVCPNIRSRYSQHQRQCHKQSQGQQSCTESNNTDVQAFPPSIYREASVMARCDARIDSSHPNPAPIKICCFCEKPLPCACDPGTFKTISELPKTNIGCACRKDKDDLLIRIDEQVMNWLNEVPIYASETVENKATREEKIKKLVEKLKCVIKDGNFERIKDVVQACLKNLPMWCPVSEHDKEIFKDKIADNLLNKLQTITKKNRFDNVISNWVDEIPLIDSQIVDKGRILDSFIYRLQSIQSNLPDYKEKLESEIIVMLEELPIKIDESRTKFISQMAEKLADKLTEAHSDKKCDRKTSTDLETAIEGEISSWLENIPGFCTENASDVKEFKMQKDALINRILEFKSKNIEDADVQAQMAEEIEEWLESTTKIKGIYLDSKTKNNLSQKLTDKLTSSAKFRVNKKTRQVSLDDQNYVQLINDWLKNIPELSDNVTDKKLVENFSKKIHEMHAEDVDDEEIQEEIEDWLDSIAKKTDVDIDSRRKNIFATKLLKTFKTCNQADKTLKQSIRNEIADLIDDETIKLSKSNKKVVADKISNILAKNIVNVLSNKSDQPQMEIIQFLEYEVNMNEEDAELLACSFIDKVKRMSLSGRPKNQIGKSIKEEVGDVLDNFKIHVDNRKDLENTLANVLADEIMRGEDPDKIRYNICSILHDAHITEKQAENISQKLVGRVQDMSLVYNSLNYKTGSDTKLRLSSGLLQPKYFKDNAEKVILEFIGEITGESSPKFKKTITATTTDLVEKINEIMSNPDFNIEDVKKEILTFLRNQAIQSDMPRKDLANDLANRIQNKIGFHTSTPRKDRISFRSKRDFSDLSMSSVQYMNDPSFQAKQLPSEELKYSNELTDIIKKWVDELPIDINKTEDKDFKGTMIIDLVGDIIDRQKYLQLNSDAKTSELEELEHLKYQVFRWLNKLPDVNDLSNLIPKTDLLMDNIKNVPIPQLIKTSGKRRHIKQSHGGIPNYLDALQDEISIWINEIPNLNVPKGGSFNEQMIEEFARKIQQLQNNGQDIAEEIKKWLRRFAKDADQNYLNKLTQALKDRLTKRGLTDETGGIQTQDSSQFIQENLFSGILDWLKELPLYQQRTSQEKRMQEQIVSDLARELKTVLEAALAMPLEVNTDLLLTEEIIRHLKRFPMETQQKTDEAFISKMAQQLLHFLKGLQMFQNISDRRSRPPDEYLNANIEDWMSTLPMVTIKSTAEKIQLDKIKTELKSRIKQLREQKANNQDLFEEITKYLKMFPIPFAKKNDEIFLKEKAEQLMQSLLAVPISARERTPLRDGMDHMLSVESLFCPKRGFKKAADILYEHIESWCEALPIYGGDTPQEKERIKTIKQNIATKLINKIGEMNLDPEVFNDDLLYEDLLQDEINNILNALSTNTEFDQTYKDIKGTLINRVKNVKEKTRKELAGQMYKQQLKEAIPRVFPRQGTLSVEEQASFDVLKSNVADAFVNLHFFGAKEELRSKFRNKINQEIMKFCNNYLKRYPASPVDNKKLNHDLFNALKSIHVPIEESLRNEVEETRTKDEIVDWAKDLPMKEQTGTEKLHTNKVMSILAKRLHNLEKDKELYSDFEDKLKAEITKWTKKLPIPPELAYRIDDFVNKLVETLRNTEQSRRFSMSGIHIHSIDNLPEDSSVNSYHQSMLEKQKKTPSPAEFNNSCITRYISPFPPCTLNSEDKAHLQRIRERSSFPTRFKICSPVRKDASVSPAPIDTGSQTEIGPSETSRNICSGMQETPSTQMSPQGIDMRPEVIPCIRTPTSPYQTSGEPQTSPSPSYDQSCPGQVQASTPCTQRNQFEVSPRVIIKEHGWESTDQNSAYQLSPQSCHRPEHSQYQRPPCLQSFTRTNISLGQSYATAPQPCVTPQGSIPHASLPSQVNIDGDHYVAPKRPRTRFEEQSAQPCFGLENEVGTSRSFRRPRVTRLGSLDDVQNSNSRRPRSDRPDDFEWSSPQFQEESDFWETPCSRRRVILSEDEMPEPYTRERERKEEKVSCRCRERILTKCIGRRRCPSCQTNEESLKRCSKCCGATCPYPSYMYFR